MSATDAPQSFLVAHPWVSVLLGVCATITAVGASFLVLRRIAQPSFDEAVWDSMKRKTPEWEHHMRHTVFKDDMEAREHTHKIARSALRLAKNNAQGIAQLLELQRESAATAADVPHMRSEVASLRDAVGRVADSVDQLATSTNRLIGTVDEMRRQSGGVSIPPGAAIPVGNR